MSPAPPLAILLELTHRCPLQCPYCSNPMALDGKAGEFSTAQWRDVIAQAADLGVLQAHFSGGEPMAHAGLSELVREAAARGLYSNLITSAVLLTPARAQELADAGLDHVQISIQDAAPASADRIAGFDGAHARKAQAASAVRAAGLPLTVNAVVHRQNLERLPQMIALALEWGAQRLEVAHVQYYGWALANRAALLPTRVQVDRATEIVEAARRAHEGRLAIDYVVPDYYAARPKACMGGWGRQFLNVTPIGRVLPCHAAETIRALTFDSVLDRPLAEIWAESPAFAAFRGTQWMPNPCASCDRREIDWGGCRCQALAIAGDAAATDPACALSPLHGRMLEAAAEADAPAPPFRYRRFGG